MGASSSTPNTHTRNGGNPIMHRVFRLTVFSLALGATALAIGACGSTGGTKTIVEKQAAPQPPTETVTVAKPAPASANDDTGSSSPAPASEPSEEKVPDLVGERLDVAESDLDDAGISYKE